MTTIGYHKDLDEFSITADGHAGFAEAGNDIVCAGISTLLQTLTAHIPDVAVRFDYRIEAGRLWCYAYGRDARIAFDTILTGLEILESMFPQYLCITKGCPLITENPLR